MSIVDAQGEPVANYQYDPYGNLIGDEPAANSIGAINPLRYRGYYFDSESTLYYLQSRYYDPEMGRFINADSRFSSSVGFFGFNLFTYCVNSPISYKDSSGNTPETALDVVSAIFSLLDFIGKPSWLNAGYLVWDVASIFIPFIPASYVAKGTKVILKVASKIDDFLDGSELLLGTYKKLKKLVKGIKGIEIHHLIEKRFSQLFSCSPGEFLSIALTPEMHRIITNRWRNLHKIDEIFEDFAYGSDYAQITYDLMVKAVNEVYQDMPAILSEVLEWVEENWKRGTHERIYG